MGKLDLLASEDEGCEGEWPGSRCCSLQGKVEWSAAMGFEFKGEQPESIVESLILSAQITFPLLPAMHSP